MKEVESQPLRPCGDCTACCDGWMASAKLDMRPGKPCRHNTGNGCAIYNDRPKGPCRSFTRAWVHPESELPEDMRPDRCGAIIKWGARMLHWDLISVMPAGDSIPQATLERLIRYTQEQDKSLLFYEHIKMEGEYGSARQFAVGPADFMEAAAREIKQTDTWSS